MTYLSHLYFPNKRKVAGFDVASTEELKIFQLPTLMFCLSFHNLSEGERESGL